MHINEIKLIRKFLKLKTLEDNISFRNYEKERQHVYDLITRTIVQGESHSALIIGPRGCGKTTLINSVLHQVSKEVDVSSDAIIVKLNGLIHNDDKIALKSITSQMQLENAVGDRVFGTFAENLSYLLGCLMSGVDRRCKSMVFVLEEFDMFCHSGRTQTLLYNLFDITHSKQAPMCVLGITNRIDVMELLEKRVKSRFSHRHIFMFPNENYGDKPRCPVKALSEVFVQCLTIPPSVASKKGKTPRKRKNSRKSLANQEDMDTEEEASKPLDPEIMSRCNMSPEEFQNLESCLEDWNSHIQSLVRDDTVKDALEQFAYYTVNEQIFRDVLFQLVSKLSPRKPYISPAEVSRAVRAAVEPETRRALLRSLSALEIALVIAAVHAGDILDGQPLNFEMILHRYTKFANANSSTQTVPRPVILKAFEHLQALEVMVPVRSAAAAGGERPEHRLYRLALAVEDVRDAVSGYKALPTEIGHWLNNSIVD